MNYTHFMNNGQIYIRNKQYVEAENVYKEVISVLNEAEMNMERTEIVAEAYNNLGFICYKKVEFDKAVEYYNKSIKLHSSYGIAYYNRGTIHYRLGCYEKAIKDMEKAVLFDPENVEFRTGLEECRRALKLVSV